MKRAATLVSPRLAFQKGDFLGSGVPYWPLELAVFASFLRSRGYSVDVLDLFGADPKELEERDEYYLQGVPIQRWERSRPVRECPLFVVFAISYMSHDEILGVVRELRRMRPEAPILVLENSQAVTAYALPHVAADLFAAGATAAICGEPYWNWEEIEGAVARGEPAPSNLMLRGTERAAVRRSVGRYPTYPVPAWDLFPLENYWALPYSHGPKTKRFFPIFTSRGCPYPCDFCVVPETNAQRWRGRAAQEVVDEMVMLRDHYDVHDFQVEDLNPTVQDSRTREIAQLLIDRKAGIRFAIVSGTKAETVELETVPLLARAGCRYLSISPESGSSRLMKLIGKPFDYDHGEKLVALCKQYRIATQACFISGHPDETAEDHAQSIAYLKRLLRAGLTEAAFFIVAPFAGSKLFQREAIALGSASRFVSFSPKHRVDFGALEGRRSELMRTFFIEKLKGVEIWIQGVRALVGRPRTKMENLPRRVVFIAFLLLRHRLRRALSVRPRSPINIDSSQDREHRRVSRRENG